MNKAAILLVALFSLAPWASASGSHDIVTTAVEDGRFETLATAVTQAGLVEALQGRGPFTVFAPTDDAFAALPDGALRTLLAPQQRDALTRVLTYHVVSGRITSKDLLTATSAPTLNGSKVPIGLRVGNANVIQADIECSNGVIHVIDRVLLPTLGDESQRTSAAPVSTPAKEVVRMDVGGEIVQAIDRGAPLYNAGHHGRCADVYAQTAQRIVDSAGSALAEMDRLDLQAALAAPAKDASERAWNLRHAFDRVLVNAEFEPRMEAAMPPGFPEPGPLGRVVTKHYPRYRAARTSGGTAFWTLFRHIKKNDVEMTAPVEMTMDDQLRMRAMAFLYEHGSQGTTGRQGSVDVVDLEPVEVLSIGMRGARDAQGLERAKTVLTRHMQAAGLQRAGDWRVLGYNSPMVPASERFWELQVPVAR